MSLDRATLLTLHLQIPECLKHLLRERHKPFEDGEQNFGSHYVRGPGNGKGVSVSDHPLLLDAIVTVLPDDVWSQWVLAVRHSALEVTTRQREDLQGCRGPLVRHRGEPLRRLTGVPRLVAWQEQKVLAVASCVPYHTV